MDCSSPELLAACRKQGVIEQVDLQLTSVRRPEIWSEEFREDITNVTRRNKEHRVYKARLEGLPKGDTRQDQALLARSLSSVASDHDDEFLPHLVYLALRMNTKFLLDA